MVYELKENTLFKVDKKFEENQKNLIYIFSSNEFSKLEKRYSNLKIYRRHKTYRCTQIEVYNNYIYCDFYIPSKINMKSRNSFECIIFKDYIIFIDDGDFVEKIISNICVNPKKNNYNLGKFFYEILSEIIYKDIVFLDSYDEKLSKIEQEVIENNFEKIISKLPEIKRHLMLYCRHYSQLLSICDIIKEMVTDFFDKDTIHLITLYSNRVDRLREESEILKEYCVQIQDMYQAQINVRQNDIMKTLTIVTTIVLPLSLVAGWYGMNFKYMPELNTRYGYYVIIVVSIIIVLFCLVLFKKKKYF